MNSEHVEQIFSGLAYLLIHWKRETDLHKHGRRTRHQILDLKKHCNNYMIEILLVNQPHLVTILISNDNLSVTKCYLPDTVGENVYC